MTDSTHHPDTNGLSRILLVPAVVAVASTFLAVLYAFVLKYNPADELNFLLPAVWAWGVLLVAGWTVSEGDFPGTYVGSLAVLGCLFGYLASWAFWACLYHAPESGHFFFVILINYMNPVRVFHFLSSPGEVAELAASSASIGDFDFFGVDLAGRSLVFARVAEGVIFLTTVFLLFARKGGGGNGRRGG
ncbi:MAG: hypothetical protein LBQ12_07995 [Deltaproteobacteria bacterium]|jgi:hypothetical protein|nr:hypothetical protein [Deltaproteobacteria bacterium]